MSPKQKKKAERFAFERVPVAELTQGRRGKHHALLGRIAKEIESLGDGEALKIPLRGIAVSLANLRSAVSRDMASRKVRTATYSDGHNLYVWKKTAATADYERKGKKGKAARGVKSKRD